MVDELPEDPSLEGGNVTVLTRLESEDLTEEPAEEEAPEEETSEEEAAEAEAEGE